ncbi:nucleotidyltransferase family protein [Pseudosulfitobacter pseudonitzschiae]|uniref:nucleotidyltransferase family protein n=1 Tax=Pseudosulfitobacter pseudonitzschiae TaxID=1402135 RepID=UPI001AFC64E7|nr:nucleotidyltransferase family protein [Pseudosulfitobacter pseudonitzschiae]MBM1815640.1 nucleotidyltransferase family protein [Pseudosulfitobacter pseudonitzschiae]MBM1832631.1 nucleotidyltransferase family protein [Pseudosulfitobacter pseudonitzschiae]MBM1837499.1 nucleotidyltransferase family protein [Pseudosulfitobacter pseudonitzschiae]MBM1842345.1 nucleotidyltransferase family protein [Pseudosulfitobacter pseudonitzschiae]MBM1847213.1 nucleotidyltransferase family protein [Pseudosulfi
MRDTAVMIFAAGFGTRMRHLTQDRPKPMVPVAGRPLIDHALEMVQAIAPDRIVANLHYLPEVLETHLAGTGVQTVTETGAILETGGGLRNALPMLGAGPVFTVNPDAIWTGSNPLQALRAAWDPAQMDALLMCVPVAQAVGYAGQGDFAVGNDGWLKRGPGAVYGGVQIIKTDRLAEIAEDSFSLNVLWDMMLQDNRLFGITHMGRWCDVGHPEGIALAEAMLAADV